MSAKLKSHLIGKKCLILTQRDEYPFEAKVINVIKELGSYAYQLQLQNGRIMIIFQADLCSAEILEEPKLAIVDKPRDT